jgi:hypothetical protein
MARNEDETFQEYLEGAACDKDGRYRTRDGRIFETAMSYPDKLTVEEFISEITNQKRNQAFIDNMHHLEGGSTRMPKEKHAEDWIQTYAAWMEMNGD